MSGRACARKLELSLVAPRVSGVENEEEEEDHEKQNSSLQNACGDHPNNEIRKSESGVELKSLLKLIDNVMVTAPTTDDEDELKLEEIHSDDDEDEEEEGEEGGFKQRNPFENAPTVFTFDITTQSQYRRAPRPSNSDEGKIIVSETLFVPVKKYPKYNFVGRILGPRGMTVKQLERETGCKIFVRGRASSTAFNPHTKAMRPTPFNPRTTLSTISQSALTEDPLHVFIECCDFPERANKKLENAVGIIKDLLSPPADGKDELKRQQLVDISLINGTYRATNPSPSDENHSHRWGTHSIDPTAAPEEFDLKPLRKEFGGPGSVTSDFGTCYGITQQRRIWQKPRGPDTTSEEFAKSVSSREFVSDFVTSSRQSPGKFSPSRKASSSEEPMYQLPQSVVSETLKAAKNLIDSHEHMSFAYNAPEEYPPPQCLYRNRMASGDASAAQSVQSVQSMQMMPLPDFSVPPPPIPLMQAPSYHNMYPNDFYYPPPPPPSAQHPDFMSSNGMYYMFPQPPPLPPRYPQNY